MTEVRGATRRGDGVMEIIALSRPWMGEGPRNAGVRALAPVAGVCNCPLTPPAAAGHYGAELPASSFAKYCKLIVDKRKLIAYTLPVIRTFRNKELSALFAGGKSKIDARLHRRIITRLDTLDRASSIESLMIEGYNFHPLRGFKPTRYTIHVNGPSALSAQVESPERKEIAPGQ